MLIHANTVQLSNPILYGYPWPSFLKVNIFTSSILKIFRPVIYIIYLGMYSRHCFQFLWICATSFKNVLLKFETMAGITIFKIILIKTPTFRKLAHLWSVVLHKVCCKKTDSKSKICFYWKICNFYPIITKLGQNEVLINCSF